MIWLDWVVPLPGVVFLFTVLHPLPDRTREAVGNVVTGIWLGLLLVAFVVSGPKLGIAAVVGSLAWGGLGQPLANGLARRMYPFRLL